MDVSKVFHYLDIIRHRCPNVLPVLPVLQLEVRDRAAAVVPHAQVKGDPRYIHYYEFIGVTRRVFRLRPFGGGLHDLAGRSHTDPIERGHVHLIDITAPQTRQDVTVDIIRHLHLFPFTGLPLVVKNITPDLRPAIVAALPLDVDRITRRAGGVK